MQLLVSTSEIDVLQNLIEKQELTPGIRIEPIPGVFVEYRGRQPRRRSLGGTDVFEIAITYSGHIAVAVIAHWLYDRLRGKVAKIRINNKPVDVDWNQISKSMDISNSEEDSKI